MNEDDPSENDKVICTCTGTTKAKVIELINKGAKDLDKIASATGASTGCGSCDVEVMDILEEYGL
ncbi:MAG: (2Fe-2S)-binding protein [Methylococcales symbiont of Hymedesmia sp. n. MRB-2018]|nr:MAG: (2Fe-2S)-binding protein [Methylococcales symbiont of Hymedesmia sp. n. MRB-2018]KAF3983137.1 MAG: (2Fe-2S)-binding protein [Methylococcales symbiont of Hymedesmia sp. n. MRB-2018]